MSKRVERRERRNAEVETIKLRLTKAIEETYMYARKNGDDEDVATEKARAAADKLVLALLKEYGPTEKHLLVSAVRRMNSKIKFEL